MKIHQMKANFLNTTSSEMRNCWPWLEEIPQLPPTMPDGSIWPKLSIVTPSFNQGQYLEETIRSVLLQGYPNLEYIVMDGGSTDGSVEIIKKYEPWLAYWTSEPDGGQGDAINKGFAMATGELAGWINSDDIYFPRAFEVVVSWWIENGKPDDLITGTKLKGNSTLDSLTRLPQQPFTNEHLQQRCIVEQPSTFFTLKRFKGIGGIDERYHFSIDYDLWLRMTSKGAIIRYIDADLAVTRVHSSTKTSRFQKRSCRESLTAVWRSYRVIPNLWVKKLVTAYINPGKTKNRFFREILTIIRNILYHITRLIFKLLAIPYQAYTKLIK